MVRQITIVGLIICCMAVLHAFAGTWRDDFEDGDLDDWLGVTKDWTVEDGECSGEFFNAPPDMAEIIITGDVGWRNYTVRCKIKFMGEPPPSGSAGLTFRDSNMAWGRYSFGINADEDTAVGNKSVEPNVTQPSEVPLDFTLSEDTWYELEIIVEGDHFEFYIDGEPAGEFDDKSLSSGNVGLFVRNTQAHFDDVVITGPEIPDGGPGFAITSQSKLATVWGSVKRGK